MMSEETYGDKWKYCAARVPPGKEKLTPVEQSIMEMLNTYDANLRDRVERTFRQWNQIIREYLRSETALRISVGEDQQAVPVKVVNGLPDPFESFVAQSEPELWMLYLHRSLLARTEQGLQVVCNNYEQIVKTNAHEVCASSDAVNQTHKLLVQLNAELNKQNLLNELLSKNEDILGAYFFRVPEIHLYWMAIGLVASILDVSVEGLTVVVLVHELTHAYTHLGKDIDGNRWPLEAFAQSDLEIVEGLAQFYTKTLCTGRLGQRFPETANAYNKLIEKQSGPYLVHKDWAKDSKKVGEIIRFTMINARLKSLRKYEDFRSEMNAIMTLIEGGQ